MACILASKEGSGCYIVNEGQRDKGNTLKTEDLARVKLETITSG
jgi:hypothetical protein